MTIPNTTSSSDRSQNPPSVQGGIPELLAPAGCFPSLQAAVNAGADAVYFGLAQLNMRARARRSFGGNDLPEIMKRIHGQGCKGFLTLNTLLYEHDLPLAYTLLDQAAEQEVDAVIVADIAAMEGLALLSNVCMLGHGYTARYGHAHVYV